MSGESSTQPPAIAPKQQPVPSSSTASDATKVNGTTPAQNGNGNATTDENKEAQDQSDIELTKLFTAKRDEEMARRDRTLAEFLVMLDGYKPLVCLCLAPLSPGKPLTVRYRRRLLSTTYNAQDSIVPTLDCELILCLAENTSSCVRKRLLSLSAQKFVSDLSRDAFHFAKLRVNGTSARGRPAAPVS